MTRLVLPVALSEEIRKRAKASMMKPTDWIAEKAGLSDYVTCRHKFHALMRIPIGQEAEFVVCDQRAVKALRSMATNVGVKFGMKFTVSAHDGDAIATVTRIA